MTMFRCTYTAARFLFAITVVGLSFLAAGCAPSMESPEGELLEHAEIPHKPKSFAAGVESLARRHAAWLQKPATSSEAAQAASLDWSEMLDVVRWLPELAGDSDMPEREWNQVRDLSRDLLQEYEHLRQSPNQETLQGIATRLERLRELVPSAVP